MKKLLAIILVLAMAATLFVAAPVNAAAPVNLLGRGEEVFDIQHDGYSYNSVFDTIPFGSWPREGSYAVYSRTWYAFDNGDNVKYGNYVLSINNGTDASKHSGLNVVKRNLTPGATYTFYVWIKGEGVLPASGDLDRGSFYFTCDAYQASPAAGVSVPVNGGLPNSSSTWYSAHNTIAAANSFVYDVDHTDPSSGFNSWDPVNGNFDWTLLKYTFTVPLTVGGAPTKTIVLGSALSGRKGKLSFDGFGLVAGDKVPTDEVMYAEDMDRDGIKNINDTDMDGDGILNVDDLDANGDGIDDATDVDIDKDGIINKYDSDIDGDGIKNIFDKDIDGDYILNIYDRTPMGCLLERAFT